MPSLRRHLRNTPPALRTRAKGLLSPAQLQQDRDVILEKYHDAGYIFAQVDTRVQETPEGVNVTFRIDEGTRVRIRSVEFSGNESVASGTLLGLMSTREKDFWFFGLLRPGFYDFDVLEADLENVESYYFSHGYFDARAELKEIRFDSRKENMAIVVRIREGPRYTFRGYTVDKQPRVLGPDTP